MSDSESAPLPALIIASLVDDDGQIIAVDFNGNFLESPDAVTWKVTPGSRDPLGALTKLPDGSLVAVGNSGAIWISPAPRPYQPPRITAITLGEDSEGEIVRIEATGTPGLNYQLSSSQDLSRWNPDGSLTAKGPAFEFVLGRPLGERSYYRVEDLGREER